MIQFIVSPHAIFDTSQDSVVDHLYRQMPLHAHTLWVESSEGHAEIHDWCQRLFPRRLILLHQPKDRDDVKRGMINLITAEQLIWSTPEDLLISRHIFIPLSTSYGRLIHWVDHQRENSRECYRNYQHHGLKPSTLSL